MKSEKGFTLIEVAISILVLGIIGVGFLTALSGSTKSLISADKRTMAESLVRSQWEYVKSQQFRPDFSYAKITPSDTNYTIAMGTDNETLLAGLQKISYRVMFKTTQQVITMTDYKLNR